MCGGIVSAQSMGGLWLEVDQHTVSVNLDLTINCDDGYLAYNYSDIDTISFVVYGDGEALIQEDLVLLPNVGWYTFLFDPHYKDCFLQDAFCRLEMHYQPRVISLPTSIQKIEVVAVVETRPMNSVNLIAGQDNILLYAKAKVGIVNCWLM